MSLLDNVAPAPRKVMTLFYVVDTSGSMCGSKIGSVNSAMEEAITSDLPEISAANDDAEIKVAIMQFSSGCSWITPQSGPIAIGDVIWNDLNAGGVTDLGAACKELDKKLSRNEYLNSQTGAYAPVILLFSDGGPTDNWEKELKQLKLTAAKARLYGVQMVHDAASGHPGGSLSCMDVLTYLYFAEMHIDPKNPHDPDRDRFVMSKGHCSPALYPILALRGFFPVENLKMFRRIDGHMSGHVEMHYNPGVDMSTGSLGQGISVAVGMALAGKVAKKDYRVYAILGDGEVAEGQVWEAMMAASKYHLDNLCACVDVNGLQIDGETKDVMPTEPLDKKFEAFGWHVVKCDGHDFADIERAYKEAAQVKGQPTMILAKTVKGKGVSFMENNAGWHGKAPNDEQWAIAKAELEAQIKELEG